MDNIRIYRKRYIPEELIDISSDEKLYIDKKTIITRWTPIKPRDDFNRGISAAFLEKGYKISKIFKDDRFLYWYCDIIDVEFDRKNNIYTLVDLIVDVKVYPDGMYEILDLEEISTMLHEGIISPDIAAKAIKRLSELLQLIYIKQFPQIEGISKEAAEIIYDVFRL